MYEVNVVFMNEIEDGKGNVRVKKTRELILVPSALSPEYAIQKVADYLKDSPTPFEMANIKKSNVKVILTDNGEL